MIRILLILVLAGVAAAVPRLQPIRSLTVPYSPSLALSSDGRWLAIASEGRLRIVDLNTGRRVLEAPVVDQDQSSPCAFAPGLCAVVSGGKLTLYGLPGWRPTLSLAADGHPQFSGDGVFVTSGSKVFRVTDGAPVQVPEMTRGLMSSTGHRMLACTPTRATLVDLETGAVLGRVRTLTEGDRPVLSPDGSRFAVLRGGQVVLDEAALRVERYVDDVVLSPGWMAVYWTEGGEANHQFTRLYGLDGHPLGRVYDQALRPAADSEPVCPGPVSFAGGLAIALPESLVLLDASLREQSFPHPHWYGPMVAVGPLLVTTAERQLQLWSPRGRVSETPLPFRPTAMLARGSTVVLHADDRIAVFRVKY